MDTLVVFSHLRWNFVYQRPQHLMSRLASRWRVMFFEEPITGARQPWLERVDPCPGVQIWRPHVTGQAPGFHDDHLLALQRLLSKAMHAQRVSAYWSWFYTPMAFPLASSLSSRGVVYDCMDELSAFKNAPRQLMQREGALFKVADLVFTGGPSLYKAKRERHRAVHCFASSVDARHFTRTTKDHPLQAALPHPRLGWCGVIDERVDLELIAQLAGARPDWQIVMVGPSAKIDPGSLPRRPNIHWLGQQGYEALPQFISNWDVCLLPFALNDATRFISPTKILEYMACGRPCVSTPIRDVEEPYRELVSIARTPREFLAACEAVLARGPGEQARHARALAGVVARTSWDATAQAMARLIARADARKGRARATVGAQEGSGANMARQAVAG